MLKFKEFLKERYQDPDDIKGWMSPKGKVHIFDSGTEHGLNLPPEIKRDTEKPKYPFSKSEVGSNLALSKGYARFGKEGNLNLFNYIHFDHTLADGKKSAVHALRYLDPDSISHRPHIDITKAKTLHQSLYDREELQTNKRSEALTFILK